MPDFGIEVEGDRLVALRFEAFPEKARAALARRMTVITQQLLSRVRSAEPSRTGRLRSETAAFVDNRENGVVGHVKVVAGADRAEHGKGGALEYGAHRPTPVKGHASRLDHVWARQIQPRSVIVAAYNRRTNITARRFLRGSLDGMRGQVIEELRQALAEAAAAG